MGLRTLVLFLVVLQGANCWQEQQYSQDLSDINVAPSTRGASLLLYNETLLYVFGGRNVKFENTSIDPSDTTTENALCGHLNFCTGDTHGECKLGGQNGTTPICDCFDGFQGDECSIEEVETFIKPLYVYNIAEDIWTRYFGDPATSDFWPENTFMHSVVRIGNKMLMYGGYSQLCSDYCSSVWEYNLDSQGDWIGWEKYPQNPASSAPAIPAERWMHMAFVYNDEMYILWGHREENVLQDLWIYHSYDDVSELAADNQPPVYDDVVEVWNNQPGSENSTAHMGRYWEEIEQVGAMPSARTHFAWAESATGIYIYGGFLVPEVEEGNRRVGGSAYFLDEFYYFRFGNWRWETVIENSGSERPSYSADASMLVVHDILLMHGGYYNNEYSSDLWRYNISSRYWTLHKDDFTPEPTKRALANMFFYTYGGVELVYLFGGHGSESSLVDKTTIPEQTYNDLWYYDLNSCPGDCWGRGTCEFGYCFCEDGFYGDDCQLLMCAGDHCEYSVASRKQECTHCTGFGACVSGGCRCNMGYGGLACELGDCPNNCTQRGTCRPYTNLGTTYAQQECVCQDGFLGDDCSYTTCAYDCNTIDHGGYCDDQTGECVCAADVEGGEFLMPDCIDFLRLSPASSTRPSVWTALLMALLCLFALQ